MEREASGGAMRRAHFFSEQINQQTDRPTNQPPAQPNSFPSFFPPHLQERVGAEVWEQGGVAVALLQRCHDPALPSLQKVHVAVRPVVLVRHTAAPPVWFGGICISDGARVRKALVRHTGRPAQINPRKEGMQRCLTPPPAECPRRCARPWGSGPRCSGAPRTVEAVRRNAPPGRLEGRRRRPVFCVCCVCVLGGW